MQPDLYLGKETDVTVGTLFVGEVNGTERRVDEPLATWGAGLTRVP